MTLMYIELRTNGSNRKEVILIADIFLNELTGRGMAEVGNSNVTAKLSEIRKL